MKNKDWDDFPLYLKSIHLVELGLYNTEAAVHRSRIDGKGPSFIRFGPRKIRYDKEDVRRWLEIKRAFGSHASA